MLYNTLSDAGSMYSDWGSAMMSGWGGMFFFPLIPIIFLGLLVWLIVFLVRGGSGRDGIAESATALDILQARFARGEIDQTEYEERRDVLSGGAGAAKPRVKKAR